MRAAYIVACPIAVRVPEMKVSSIINSRSRWFGRYCCCPLKHAAPTLRIVISALNRIDVDIQHISSRSSEVTQFVACMLLLSLLHY